MYKHTNAALEVEGLTMAEKCALLVLCARANEEGKCFPSYPKIAKDGSMSLATAKRSVKSLIDKNIISVEAGKGRSNNYKINIKWCHSDTTRVNHPAHADTGGCHTDTIVGSHRHPNRQVIENNNTEESSEDFTASPLTYEEAQANRKKMAQFITPMTFE